MKFQTSWTDWAAGCITAFALLCGSSLYIDAKYFSKPVVEPVKVPVSYCEVEVINRVEENGTLTESSMCLKSSFIWEAHIGKTLSKFETR